MHNKHLINVGFYLLLIFSFTAAIFPSVAYVAAGGLFFLWLLDLLIFREPEFVNMPLFYPILGLMIVLLVSWLVARLYGTENDFIYLAFLSLFYFIVPGFVVTNEQRSMVLWTLASGVLLYSGIRLVTWWGGMSLPGNEAILIGQPHFSFIILAICIMAAFLVEGRGIFERLFYLLVSLPLFTLAMLIEDKTIILALIAILTAIAVFRDKRLLIPVAAAAVLLVIGLGGIQYYLEGNLGIRALEDFVLLPLNAAISDPDIVTRAWFFGAHSLAIDFNMYHQMESPFFLDLIGGSGPPAFILLAYIFFERGRESFFKYRKVALPEEKTYHLTVLLVVATLFILNLYGTAFFYPNVVLAAWLILGIYEV